MVTIAFASYGFAMPPLPAIAFCASLLPGQVTTYAGENERLTIGRVVFVIVVAEVMESVKADVRTCICCVATTRLEAQSWLQLGCSQRCPRTQRCDGDDSLSPSRFSKSADSSAFKSLVILLIVTQLPPRLRVLGAGLNRVC
jgi:hypothetical protein